MSTRILAVASLGFIVAGFGCKKDKVGQPCDLSVDAGPYQAVVNLNSSACSSGVCLKPVLDQSRESLLPPTGATCTAECSSDSDCDGELRNSNDPQDSRCKGGFLCGVPFVVGPLCCKKYCLCKDFISNAGLSTPASCEVPDARATCQGVAGGASSAGVGQQTDLYISVAPVRKLDLVFMIDNSPSMGPKIAKLNEQLPKLLVALKDPIEGTYPDLRVALIDSDLGTGGKYASGSCAPNASNQNSSYGDLGNFQMIGARECGVTGDEPWLEYTMGKAVNYDRDKDIGAVFGCLANKLGTNGCGFEQQLQALEFALAAGFTELPKGRSPMQSSFLRSSALLGLVILSDEDDCSAATNDGMFSAVNHPELKGESPSLRCATRAHECDGGTNLTENPPGYPTTASFVTDFAKCAARTDACPNLTDGAKSTDTTGPTECSPLKSFRKLAEELKALKRDSYEQVLVAGIFGWPLPGPDGKPDLVNAKYRIDLVPNPDPLDTEHPQVFDYWPVCYDPDHLPKNGKDSKGNDNFDSDAWGWGAQGGLRISAFIDEFGENGLKFSACERDYTAAIKGIGDAVAKRMVNLCVEAKLMDTDPVSPGLQPNCRVTYRTPQMEPDSKFVYQESAPLPFCSPGATHDTVTSDCWQLVYDTSKCPGNGQFVVIVRPAASIADGPLAGGTQIRMNCWTCLTSGPGCDY